MIDTRYIDICHKYIQSQTPSFNDISLLTLNLLPLYQAHSLKEEATQIPYGRYLVYECSNFHIELHIFSDNYCGSIHSHDTWGIFWLISGMLFVEDFTLQKDQPVLINSKLVQQNSACNFYPPFSDWHRVRTLDCKQQTISLHIYGAKYDQVKGQYLDNNNNIIKDKRSSFKDNALFLPHIS